MMTFIPQSRSFSVNRFVMKHIVIVGIIVMIVMVSVYYNNSAPTTATLEKVFTFSGMEWGTKPEDCEQRLAAAGFNLDEKTVYSGHDISVFNGKIEKETATAMLVFNNNKLVKVSVVILTGNFYSLYNKNS